MTPEEEFFGPNPPSCQDFQNLRPPSRENFQRAIRRGGIFSGITHFCKNYNWAEKREIS